MSISYLRFLSPRNGLVGTVRFLGATYFAPGLNRWIKVDTDARCESWRFSTDSFCRFSYCEFGNHFKSFLWSVPSKRNPAKWLKTFLYSPKTISKRKYMVDFCDPWAWSSVFSRISHQCFAVVSGTWIGLELDEAQGKNDGDVRGYRYFSCPPNHGLLAIQSRKHMCCTSVDCVICVVVEANWSKRTMTTIFSSRIPFYFSTTSLRLTQKYPHWDWKVQTFSDLRFDEIPSSHLVWCHSPIFIHFPHLSDFSHKPRIRFVCASRSTIFGSQESPSRLSIPTTANFQTHVLHCLTMSDMSLESYLHFLKTWDILSCGALIHSSIQVIRCQDLHMPWSERTGLWVDRLRMQRRPAHFLESFSNPRTFMADLLHWKFFWRLPLK